MHDHNDDQLTVGCPACIAETRAREEAARWAEAPVRFVTVVCGYELRDLDGVDWDENVRFTIEVGCPPDASTWEIDEQYADVVGEAFVMALPDSVPMKHTDHACSTMDVESITIGDVVPSLTEPVADHPSLFEEA